MSSYIPTTTDASPAKHYLTTRQGTALSPLFPSITGRAIKQALRSSTGDQLLEQRSLRRGALQELAAQGMALTTLLLFKRSHNDCNAAEVSGSRHQGSGSEQRDDRRGESDVRMTQGSPDATPTKNKYVNNGESIREKLRHIGQAAASWHDLGRCNPRTEELPPHLKPEAIGALDWNLLEKLEKTAQQEHERSDVMLWVTDSEYY